MKKEKVLSASERGKMGAKATHKKRYEMITTMSAFVDKESLNRIMRWPTDHIKRLLEAYQK